MDQQYNDAILLGAVIGFFFGMWTVFIFVKFNFWLKKRRY